MARGRGTTSARAGVLHPPGTPARQRGPGNRRTEGGGPDSAAPRAYPTGPPSRPAPPPRPAGARATTAAPAGQPHGSGGAAARTRGAAARTRDSRPYGPRRDSGSEEGGSGVQLPVGREVAAGSVHALRGKHRVHHGPGEYVRAGR
ncbi:hypothetical protein GCM10018793_37840 [Streptomyces sulfonofaciens]|uniref:Uncharacterized protein n=1 Tax=Streptomyces sulfonofaciens TaxID=68272 RepID=A0A919GBS6_9ACTN|nr:hypothetical protein GCM10018793_37840 [Streptomyces sulfonofaciens]